MIEIEKVWLSDDAIWIRTKKGTEACERFDTYPKLRNATPEQRASYVTDPFGISWPELDEDLSFEGFFSEKPDLFRFFLRHPELNAAAVARRMGISQSLFAQYISGTKKPSPKRLEEIYETLRSIGEELTYAGRK